MDEANKPELLNTLRLALTSNRNALRRLGFGNDLAKEHMDNTRNSILEAIELIKGDNHES